MSDKAVTKRQLLMAARKSEELTMQVAETAEEEIEKRPTRDEVNSAIDAAITGALGRAY